MGIYILQSGKHHVKDTKTGIRTVKVAGDAISLNDEQAKAFKDRLKTAPIHSIVETAEPEGLGSADSEVQAEVQVFPAAEQLETEEPADSNSGDGLPSDHESHNEPAASADAEDEAKESEDNANSGDLEKEPESEETSEESDDSEEDKTEEG